MSENALPCTFTTPGGLTGTLSDAGSGIFRVSLESPDYPLHNAAISISSDGGIPVIAVQQGPDAHVTVGPAGAGDFLYDSANPAP